MTYFLSAIAGYLIGSISSAVIVSRLMGLPDPRQEGSGNPGATNVLRLGGKLAAALTLIGDILKGAIPVLIAASLTAEPMAIALAGAGSFFGHLFPVFFGFKGGKGVATALGVFLAINPFIALSLALTWLTIAIIFRFSSLAAIISSASAPLWAWWFDSSDVYIVLAFALAIILVWRHSENIKRLIAGTESKIGKKS
ncbi:MAG: glycerol-3-phosphate 1-O-acyltransferase PlsY [Proteobacteria bacterium]|jgi:glycerol-3-phosphate acyltransferase PlsY|nr:glycerol-3-phosphate 1-O-acyltransferase PlsY [Pseudomonadota bacterium]MDB4825422.1 glycerol-3-phosphate 1-O-acyltransferase PlsY [Gammaproteobacteria bacterium]MBT4986958.1 glycerol-3-phosphate 1-O-acyltransferase PlsY [Pseudomonadota bacterium]MBT5190189.1 glycerol-3-phosphate 1-O-acyltransferase PlsY [Pseudomonadota bacterium]MBT6657620.1 glycerol-3-phosphate 1-O-acyltransferase PlsY [Pseudomonadota bacterium]